MLGCILCADGRWIPCRVRRGTALAHAARVVVSVRLVTLEEAVSAVVARHGGVRAAERATGVDKSFISRLMRGQKVAPSAETLEALGLRAVPQYEVLGPNVRAEAGPTAKRQARVVEYARAHCAGLAF